jgi:hypothetical protein
MRQVKRIWEDIGWARACCADLGSPMDPQVSGGRGVFQNHNAALAIWGVLKTHDIMNEYIRHNFEDHPSIAAEQVRWVTRNVMGGDKVAAGSGDRAVENRMAKASLRRRRRRSRLGWTRILLASTCWKKSKGLRRGQDIGSCPRGRFRSENYCWRH